ncbi:MAG: hypothetical protein K8T89_11960 [Planctomycetes bacterium]|nr:hypothetical protein [Planctomycetota bacterium]
MRLALPNLIKMGASQLGLGKLPQQIKDAIAFVPTKVDEALRKFVRSFVNLPGSMTTEKMFNGKMAEEKIFDYPDPQTKYILLIVVKVAENTVVISNRP